jgi:hypothetical protein
VFLLERIIAFALLTAVVLLGAVAFVNYYADPGLLYHKKGKRRQARNVRARKLVLLKNLVEPFQTLVLGSSRVLNLDLTPAQGFPHPVFNYSVTTARAEDYLVSYRLFRQRQGAPPKVAVVSCEISAFHPTLQQPWEGKTAGVYTQELVKLGAMPRGKWWKYAALFSNEHLRESLNHLKWIARGKKKGFSHKFRWEASGVGAWLDSLNAEAKRRLIARQIRRYPRSGIGLSTFRAPCPKRLAYLEQLLVEGCADGVRFIIYLAPENPILLKAMLPLNVGRLYLKTATALSELAAKHGAVFRDWHDPSSLGLGEGDFRDIMHLTDVAQGLVALKLEKLLEAPSGETDRLDGTNRSLAGQT